MVKKQTAKKTTMGKPLLNLRLEPEIMDELRRRCEPTHGKTGGVSQYVRRLIYEHLDRPLPPSWGRPPADIIDLAAAREQRRADP
jgi:hypothetical protein